MQTISVYLNQRAANTSLDYWQETIGRSLFRSRLQFRTPQNLEELNRELKNDLQEKVDAIVSVGGDGTVNTLIQSLAGTKVGLLVIPGGTANDLASELGTRNNIKKVIQTIRAHQIKQIDLIKINQRYMVTNGGLGLGGQVARKVNDLRKKMPFFKKIMKLSGRKIYSFFVASELLQMRLEYHNLAITCDQFSGQVNCAALLINNQPMLAGTFNVAPGTCNADGKFNVTILGHPTRQSLIRCILQVLRGQHPINDPHFISFETDSLEVENLGRNHAEFFGDGEVFVDDRQKWDISIRKNALTVYAHDPSQDLVDLVNEVSLQ